MTDVLTPLADRLLLRQVEAAGDSQTAAGIWLLDEDRKRYRQWVIEAVGPDVLDSTLLPGAEVVAKQYGGVPVRYADTNWMIIREGDVLAVIG